MTLPVTRKDLENAWRRLRRDHRERRTFVRRPFLLDLIQSDLNAWLGELELSLAGGTYQPSEDRTVLVPKPGGAVRPGTVLEPEDEVVYAAAVAAAMPHIVESLAALDPHPDYAYPLSSQGLPDGGWFEKWFPYYKAFTSDSIRLLDQGFSHVVIADIAGYYEQIDIPTLRSMLLAAEVPGEVQETILACLHRWGPLEKRGVPQGYSPSDILAKFYLHAVDQALAGKGYTHMRWVDDFRIFARSEADARRALKELAVQLGRRGLVLQAAKTRILKEEEAREVFEAVEALLEPVREELLQKLVESGQLTGPSAPMFLIDQLLADVGGGPSVAVLEEAFEKFFLGPQAVFQKTLFRFLLKRLGSAGSHLPLASLPDLLFEHPEETRSILEYYERAEQVESFDDLLVNALDADRFVYAYQVYEILEWRIANGLTPANDLLRCARTLASDSVDRDVRAYARAMLGRWGNDADLDDLLSHYASSERDDRAEVICCLARMEKSKRNGFLGRASGDSPNCARAAAAVKGGSVGWWK